MSGDSSILAARKRFHAALSELCLFIDEEGIPSIADSDNPMSGRIATAIVKQIGSHQRRKRLAGQTAGKNFEKATEAFLRETLGGQLSHLHGSQIEIVRGGAIHKYQQFMHLDELQKLSEMYPEIATALGSDYLIGPDISLLRRPLTDLEINSATNVVSDDVARLTGLRAKNSVELILLASVSCKWTIRSDRAQNARSEALNLIKNRKGRTPSIAIVTAEPLPSRLSSIALGTGEVDMVYHFALPELIVAVAEEDGGDAVEQLRVMVEGKRLRDISDLPFDLIV